jgi:hypothetical protein
VIKAVGEFDRRWQLSVPADQQLIGSRGDGVTVKFVGGVAGVGRMLRHVTPTLDGRLDAIAYVKKLFEEEYEDDEKFLVVMDWNKETDSSLVDGLGGLKSFISPERLGQGVKYFNKHNKALGSKHVCGFIWFKKA